MYAEPQNLAMAWLLHTQSFKLEGFVEILIATFKIDRIAK
jgi:hypothetical protein